MRLLLPVIWLGLVASIAIPLAAVASDEASSTCQDIEFEERPDRVSSATWDRSGKSLLVVDPFSNEIRRYDLHGGSSNLTKSFSTIPNFSPLAFASTERGLLFQLKQNQFIEATEGGEQLSRMVDLSAPVSVFTSSDPDGSRGQIRKIWQWAVTRSSASNASSAEEIVAFAEIFLGGDSAALERWRFDFVRYPIAAPKDFARLKGVGPDRRLHTPINDKDPIRTAFRLDYPLLAAIGSTAYALRMENPPRLYASVDGTNKLQVVTITGGPLQGLESLPDLSFNNFSSDYPAIMRRLEGASTFGGIYVQGKTLYFLSRRPNDPAQPSLGTSWTLTALKQLSGDPLKLAVVGSPEQIIGVNAAQLTVSPGPKYWAFIEKKSFTSLSQLQEIPNMYLVPAEQIAALKTGKAPCSNTAKMSVTAGGP